MPTDIETILVLNIFCFLQKKYISTHADIKMTLLLLLPEKTSPIIFIILEI